MESASLSITQVCRATGLASSALRYYERAGLISPVGRAGGRRHYSPEVVDRLAIIALLQDAGFTIGEIRELIHRRGGPGWRSLARDKLKEIDAHLERVNQSRALLVAALECGCSSLESCDLVNDRRGPHERLVQGLALKIGRRDT